MEKQVKASKAKPSGGSGNVTSGGSFLADLFGLGGGGNSSKTVKPKGAAKVKLPKRKAPWWDLTGETEKAQAKKDEKAKAPWWML
jgi:hypothetical protein